jgi:uncharacterized delta-60 repeat protein
MSIRRAHLAVQSLEDRAVPAGLLDPTFSGDGIVVHQVPGYGAGRIDKVITQADGTILAAGYAQAATGYQSPIVLRYTADGSLDPTFDGDGFNVLTMPNGGEARFFGAAVQGTKIVAAGTANIAGVQQIILARFNADGTLDGTFAGGGYVLADTSPEDENAMAVAIYPGDKIVLAGNVRASSSHFRMRVWRFNADGAVDTSFGLTGWTDVDLGPTFAMGTAVLIQPGGKILTAGYSSNSGENFSFSLARLTQFGALDPTFDGDGIVKTTPAPAQSYGTYDAALTLDGKVVVTGLATVASGTRPVLAVLRYNANGSPDLTFGGTGYVQTELPAGDSGHTEGLVVQADGKIVVAGGAVDNFVRKSFVARYNSDGTLDATFGAGGPTLMPGVAVTNIVPAGSTAGAGDLYMTVDLQADGRIVAAGHTDYGTVQELTVVRYTNDPLTAVDDAFTTPMDPPISMTGNSMANDVMPGKASPQGILVTGPAHSSFFNWQSDGRFAYKPEAGFVGTDTITYRLQSAAGTSNTATITITVTKPNAAPTAVADVYALPATGPLVVSGPGVLTNDTDPDGDALTATVVDPPAVGTLTLNPDGGFNYDFPAELVGPVTFTYKASDGTVESAPVTVTLTRGPMVLVNGSVLTILGTAGADAVRLRRSGTAIRLEVVTPDGVIVQTVRPSGAPRFTRVNVFLGAGDDHLDATGLTVPVFADGGAGNDALRTGGGRDTVVGGAGNNVLITGPGDDVVTAGDGMNEIQTDAGNDTVTTGTGGGLIDAGAGNDIVTAAGGMNYIEGGAGNDVLLAGGGADVIDGGLGNDLIAGGLGADRLEGAAGNDILIDGTVALVNPATDSLADVLADYRPANRPSLIDISTRISVTFDTAAADTLTGARGTDWFWSDDPLDLLDLTGAEPKNAQV